MIALPRPNYTAALAFAAAEAMLAGLPAESLEQLVEAIELARTHPLIDVLDAFCDGVQRLLPLPPKHRAVEIARVYSDVVFQASRRL